MAPHDLGQVGRDDGGAFHHGRPGHRRPVAHLVRDPFRGPAVGGVPSRLALDAFEALADREQEARRRLPLGHLDAVDPEGVVRGLEAFVVAGVHRWDDDPELLGDRAPQGLDALEQVAVALGVDEIDDVHAELELERHDARLLGKLGRGVGGRRSGHGDLRGVFLDRVGQVGRQPAAEEEQDRTDEEEGQLRQTRQEAEGEDDDGDGPHDAAGSGTAAGAR